MRRMTKREIAQRYPKNEQCNCASGIATREQLTFVRSAVAYADPATLPAKGYKITGKLIELKTTNDRVEDFGAWRFMTAIRPPIDGDREAWLAWKVHDNSHDKTTVWCRTVFICVEAQS
jgi:hypothetical protein